MGAENSKLFGEAPANEEPEVAALRWHFEDMFASLKRMDKTVEDVEDVRRLTADAVTCVSTWPERPCFLSMFCETVRLELVNLGLETFPSDALRLHKVSQMRLSCNLLRALPPDFGVNFPVLESLDLKACCFDDGALLMSALARVKDMLVELRLDHNELTALCVPAMRRLEVLSLAGNVRLGVLSSARKTGLPALKMLDLSYSGLHSRRAVRTLDRVLEDFSQSPLESLRLAALELDQREVLRVGELFSQSLRSLDLSANPLSLVILPTVAKLTLLQELDLRHTLAQASDSADPLPTWLMFDGGVLRLSSEDDAAPPPRPSAWLERAHPRLSFSPLEWPCAVPLDDEPPRLFVGSYNSALNVRFRRGENADGTRRRHETRRLLALGVENALVEYGETIVHVVRLADSTNANIRPHLESCIGFIQQALDAGESVLVYCRQGSSRSVSVLVAYLAATRGLTIDAALERMRALRPETCLNEHFVRQLRLWLQARA